MLTQLRRKREEGGFTLIELLIVIIILGILATVVVLSINAIRNRGNESACKTEAEQIRVAIAGYYSDAGEYPTGNVTNLNATGTAGIRDFLDDSIDATNWTFTGTSVGYTLTGAGDCAGIGPLSPSQGVTD